MAAKMEYRDLTEEQLTETEEDYATAVTPELLAEYISKVYVKTKEEAVELVKKYGEVVTNGILTGSFCYYVADQIREKELMS